MSTGHSPTTVTRSSDPPSVLLMDDRDGAHPARWTLASARLRARASAPLLAAFDELDQAMDVYAGCLTEATAQGLCGAKDRMQAAQIRRATSPGAIAGAARTGALAIQGLRDQLQALSAGLDTRLQEPRAPAPPPPPETGTPPERDPDDHLYGAALDSSWGRAAAAAPAPDRGAAVGGTRLSKSERDAAARATMLAPVLAGVTPEAAAAEWKRRFREVFDDPKHLGFASLDRKTCLKYLDLAAATLRRWFTLLEHEQRFASATRTPAASAITTLRHEQPPHRTCPRDAVLAQLVTNLFLERYRRPIEVSRHLWAAPSDNQIRWVERTIKRGIPDFVLAAFRGGKQWDESLRNRLMRHAPYPNAAWLLDNLFISGDILERADLADLVREYEPFERMEFAALDEDRLGGYTRRRVRGLCVTMGMDLRTRRRLSLRVWDGAPRAETTLLALADAVKIFGVPEVLYTDNGSDLKNEDMRAALKHLGVHQVFSRAYDPPGRGIMERGVRTLKELALPILPGFCVLGSGRVWELEELLTLPELEDRLWRITEQYSNGQIHTGTGRCPTEHYDAEIGARGLNSVAPERWLPLLPSQEVTLNGSGFLLGGIHYAMADLVRHFHGRRLVAHYDPYRRKLAYLSAIQPDGSLRYEMTVSRVGGPEEDDAPPTPWAYKREETACLEAGLAEYAKGRESRAVEQQVAAARVEGATKARRAAHPLVGEVYAARARRKPASAQKGAVPTTEPTPDETALARARANPTPHVWASKKTNGC